MCEQVLRLVEKHPPQLTESDGITKAGCAKIVKGALSQVNQLALFPDAEVWDMLYGIVSMMGP